MDRRAARSEAGASDSTHGSTRGGMKEREPNAASTDVEMTPSRLWHGAHQPMVA